MKNKVTAGILAIFLGGLGVHRFYLGQAGLGIIYLLFCWTAIPAIISLVDAIIFFTMNDHDFNLKYYRAFGNTMQPSVVIQNVQGNYTANATPAENQAANIQPQISSNSRETPFKQEGDRKYENYDFDGAIGEYRKSLNVKPNDPAVHFKLACLYSILEQTDNSLFHLNKAIEQGFTNLDEIKNHDHLAFLRTTPEYETFRQHNFRMNIPESRLQTLPAEDIISKIEKLAELKDKGAISEEEFVAQKSKLLQS